MTHKHELNLRDPGSDEQSFFAKDIDNAFHLTQLLSNVTALCISWIGVLDWSRGVEKWSGFLEWNLGGKFARLNLDHADQLVFMYKPLLICLSLLILIFVTYLLLVRFMHLLHVLRHRYSGLLFRFCKKLILVL